ncbi:MAG: DUF167 domain-containing protein [Candidatus Nitrosocosmicus sp.]
MIITLLSKYLIYTVFVKFNSSDKIQIQGNEITISLKSKPERGKANLELIQKLAGYFEVTKDKINIVSGLKLTKKMVYISD